MSKHKKKHVTNKQIQSKFRIPNPKLLNPDGNPTLVNELQKLAMQWILTQKNNPQLNSLTNFYDFHKICLSEFTKGLNKKHFIPTYTSIVQTDRIDLSHLVDEKRLLSFPNQEKIKNAMNAIHNHHLDFNYIIPCYEKGLLRTNRLRGMLFEIKDINEIEKSINITIQDIMFHTFPPKQIDSFETGRKINATIQYEDNEIQINYKMMESFVDIYTKLTPQDLNWNALKINYWENVVLQNAVNQDTYIQNIQKTNKEKTPEFRMIQIFILYIQIANYYLSKQRPIVHKTCKPIVINTSIEPLTQNQTIKRIRTINTIEFLSEKTPKLITEQNRIAYHISDWSVRGHIRHYKNGKTVYIKPQKRHRKNMKTNTNTKIQNIIELKEGKNEQNY